MRPQRQTINLTGTHFRAHTLHTLDSLNPTSYHYLEPKRQLANLKGLVGQTIDVTALPVDKNLQYHRMEDKDSLQKS